MGHAHTDSIDIVGQQGQLYRVSGPGQGGQGVFMAPNSTGLLDDAPFKTIWHKTMFGQAMSGMEWERREIVATLNIGYDEAIDPERDPDEWHDIFSEIRSAFSPTEDTKIIYGAPDGDRILYARMLEKPKPFSTHAFEGKDPKLWSFGSIVITMACEFPFYLGASDWYEWEFEGSGTFWTKLPFFNASDVAIWPYFEVTGQATWHIPDFSWGNEEYGRGLSDMDKVVRSPHLEVGENCDVYTRPDMDTWQAENDAPVGLRARGRDFEYPIPPGMGVGGDNPDEGAVFRATEVEDGGALRMELPRWYSSPFARPRLTRALVPA
jgi:hypothetical protein